MNKIVMIKFLLEYYFKTKLLGMHNLVFASIITSIEFDEFLCIIRKFHHDKKNYYIYSLYHGENYEY